MGTTNLNLMMQKCSRIVQMIIAHKVFILFTYLKDEIKKIKLRWQWNSVYVELLGFGKRNIVAHLTRLRSHVN